MSTEATRPAPILCPAQHAHAVLHCNLNTADLAQAEQFYRTACAAEPRMRSSAADADATAMGLGPSTDSETSLLYDRRGPRAAPAVELVEWRRPRTTPAAPAPAQPPAAGFAGLGFRVPSLSEAASRLAGTGRPAEPGQASVRGRLRPALHTTDPDGVPVEFVEIAPAADDPDGALLCHERLRCRDLSRTIDWFAGIGFTARPGATASLVLPEDPTFSLELAEQPGAGPPPAAANTRGLYRIALAVEDVQAAWLALREVGRDVPAPVFVPMPGIRIGGFSVLFMRDPDGVMVELVGRPRSAVRRPALPA